MPAMGTCNRRFQDWRLASFRAEIVPERGADQTNQASVYSGQRKRIMKVVSESSAAEAADNDRSVVAMTSSR